MEWGRPLVCSYCDRPLNCEGCGLEFEPLDQAQYEALSRPEVPLICPGCDAVLVCRWCRVPYDGQVEESDAG